jgi:general secretion pathway protein M
MVSLTAMPTGRNDRISAFILMLIALASVYLIVLVSLMNLYAARQSVLENRRMLVPRLGAAAEELPALRARASELRTAAGARKVTLEGASDAIASANLQSRIEELAASVGPTISSTEGLPAEVRGGYRRIGLRYVLVGTYETLLRLLAKLEAVTPPLVIDNLHIQGGLRVDRRPGRQATPGAATPALNAGLDVYGFRTKENPAVAKP